MNRRVSIYNSCMLLKLLMNKLILVCVDLDTSASWAVLGSP